MKHGIADEELTRRWHQVRSRIENAGADGILLGGGADLKYLTGYDAMPLERITALVGRSSSDEEPPSLIVPELEEARVRLRPSVYTLHTWNDTTDSVEAVASALPTGGRVLVSDNLWALHVLGLQRHSPNLQLVSLSDSVGGLRTIKSAEERDALAEVGSFADKVAAQIQRGEVPLVGRTESDIASDIAERLIAVGHEAVEFVIVASGPNAASPHHHPGSREVEDGEIVLFDFGGRFNGYCSDTTRCVHTGPVPARLQEAYEVLAAAQEAAVQAAQPGTPLAEVDLAARRPICASGYGDYFIHRIGHGIGTEVHEHPYVTETNTEPVQVGHAFSIEPGIYIPDQWGIRLEDIVVIDPDGPRRCNNSDRQLVEI